MGSSHNRHGLETWYVWWVSNKDPPPLPLKQKKVWSLSLLPMNVPRKRKRLSSSSSSSPPSPLDDPARTMKVDVSTLRNDLGLTGLPTVLIQDIIYYVVPLLLHDIDHIAYDQLGAALGTSCDSFKTGVQRHCVVIRNLDLSLTATLHFEQLMKSLSTLMWRTKVSGDVTLLNSDVW